MGPILNTEAAYSLYTTLKWILNSDLINQVIYMYFMIIKFYLMFQIQTVLMNIVELKD